MGLIKRRRERFSRYGSRRNWRQLKRAFRGMTFLKPRMRKGMRKFNIWLADDRDVVELGAKTHNLLLYLKAKQLDPLNASKYKYDVHTDPYYLQKNITAEDLANYMFVDNYGDPSAQLQDAPISQLIIGTPGSFYRNSDRAFLTSLGFNWGQQDDNKENIQNQLNQIQNQFSDAVSYYYNNLVKYYFPSFSQGSIFTLAGTPIAAKGKRIYLFTEPDVINERINTNKSTSYVFIDENSRQLQIFDTITGIKSIVTTFNIDFADYEIENYGGQEIAAIAAAIASILSALMAMIKAFAAGDTEEGIDAALALGENAANLYDPNSATARYLTQLSDNYTVEIKNGEYQVINKKTGKPVSEDADRFDDIVDYAPQNLLILLILLVIVYKQFKK